MTPESLDALADWWRDVLEDRKATLTPGGPGWADVQAKLAIVREYEQTRDEVAELDGESFLGELAIKRLETLGWAMQTLALPYADRDGWVSAWRAES